MPFSNPNFFCGLHQLCIVTIFQDIKKIKKIKKNVIGLIFSNHPKQSRHIQSKEGQWNVEATNFFSSSTPLSAIPVYEKIKSK